MSNSLEEGDYCIRFINFDHTTGKYVKKHQ